MKIEQITLKNFLSHEQSSIVFRGSINAIIGPNGAGKSSIIDGIIFSLFTESYRGTNEDLIRRGRKVAELELSLSRGNERFIIKRNIPTTTYDTLIKSTLSGKDTIPLARSRKEVNKKLEELLHLDKEVFLSTVIVRQGDIEGIFKELPEVMKKVLKLENLEKLTDSNGKITVLIREIEEKIKNLDSQKKIYDSLLNQKTTLEKEIESLEKNIEDLQSKKDEISSKLAELERIQIEEEEKRQQYVQLKAKLELLQNNLRKLVEDTKDLEEKRQALSIVEEELDQLEIELQRLREKKDKLLELKVLQNRLIDLERRISDLNREVDDYKKKLSKKASLEDKAREYEELEKEFEGLKLDYQKYLREESNYEQNKRREKQLETDLEKYQIFEEPEELESKKDEIRKKIEERTKFRGELEGRRKELQKIVTNLAEVKGNSCPVCRRPLDEEHKSRIKKESEDEIREINIKLNELDTEIRKLEQEEKVLEKRIKEIRDKVVTRKRILQDLERIREQIKEQERILSQLADKKKRYEEVEKRVSELKPIHDEYLQVVNYTEQELSEKENKLIQLMLELDNNKAQYDGLINQLQIASEEIDEEIKSLQDKIRQKEEYYRRKQEQLVKIKSEIQRKEKEKVEIDEIKTKIAEVESALKILNFDEVKYKELLNEIDKVRREFNDINAELSRLIGKLESNKSNLTEINKEIEKIKKDIAQIPNLQKGLEKLNKLRKDLGGSGLQDYIISTVKRKIENNLNEILGMFNLSFSRALIDFTIGGRSIKGKAEIKIINTSGEEFNVNMLSGGERIALALALRLAIAKALLDDIGFVILDEPTVHLDEERRKELLNIIKYSMNIVPQIIIVTHDEEVKEIADYIISVYKRGNLSIVKQGEVYDQQSV